METDGDAERPMGHCLVRAPVLVNMEDCGSVWELLSCSSAAGAGLLLSPSKVHLCLMVLFLVLPCHCHSHPSSVSHATRAGTSGTLLPFLLLQEDL